MGVHFQKWKPTLFIFRCWRLCPAGPCFCCESIYPCLVASQAAPWFFLHQLCATLPVPLDLPCLQCNAAETASREGGGFVVWREVAVFIESSGAWGGDKVLLSNIDLQASAKTYGGRKAGGSFNHRITKVGGRNTSRAPAKGRGAKMEFSKCKHQ